MTSASPWLASLVLLATAGCSGSSTPMEPEACTTPPDAETTFFVTERGNEAGGNFGGLTGADKFCQDSAAAAGLGDKTWTAYLSTAAVHAKDRIGDGPWKNSRGVSVGSNSAIHSSGINKANILTECGRAITYIASDPNGNEGAHDILTGSNAEGELQRQIDPSSGLPEGAPATCSDWTSSASSDTGWVGHSDWDGGTDGWNWAHDTLGCHLAGLRQTGSIGRLYCFVAN